MKRGAGPGEPLHPGHRSPAIQVGVMVAALFENAEYAGPGVVAALSARDLGTRDQARAAIDVDLLVAQRDDESKRLEAGGRDNRGLRRYSAQPARKLFDCQFLGRDSWGS